jgi:hypothetical protein
MKIIFLDIDGVLNSELYMIAEHNKSMAIEHKIEQTRFERQVDEIDPKAMSFLNDLIKETEAKVVISSTWRRSNTIESLTEIFKARDFIGEIIGFTPRLSEDCLRGNEIYKWIKDNDKLLGMPYYDFNSYIILDDDSDMLYWQKDNFFKTDGYVGLTPTIVYKATWFLNKRGK